MNILQKIIKCRNEKEAAEIIDYIVAESKINILQETIKLISK